MRVKKIQFSFDNSPEMQKRLMKFAAGQLVIATSTGDLVAQEIYAEIWGTINAIVQLEDDEKKPKLRLVK